MENAIFKLIQLEEQRQEQCVNLIASENYVHPDVLAATGSVLTNKYAEGYPGRRYYGGCEIVDQIESKAIQLAQELFKADCANVQPHSGSSANMAVYFSQLQLGDTILAMSLDAGGHLTHGHKMNFSGKLYNMIHYGINPETGLLDYNQIEQLAAQHRPKMLVAGASAYSRLIDYARLAHIAKTHNMLFFVDMAHIAGLVAAGIIPSPVPYADIVSSTTHKTLRGPRGGIIVSKQPFGASIDKTIIPGSQGGPLLHVIAAKAIAFTQALEPSFKTYQEQVIKNAQAMAQTFQELGYHVISGGTDTHLFLIDLKKSAISSSSTTKITGKLVEETLGRCNITLNRNMVFQDTESPFITSGIRIGTPAITTRGFTELEAVQLVHWIDEAIRRHDDEHFLTHLKAEIMTLCSKFPIYGSIPVAGVFGKAGFEKAI
ncbi:serine hydroxymethyltransferase [Candidatus Dependentiae bacterium]|jgi:glycine hydroxymethyltransferase|nr:serine hydroxymethyltransferase [Candidatus Dependentiae bacterium]